MDYRDEKFQCVCSIVKQRENRLHIFEYFEMLEIEYFKLFNGK